MELVAQDEDTEFLPYSHLLLVGNRPKDDDLPGRLWFTLKHRLDFQEELLPKNQSKNTRVSKRKKIEGPVTFDAFIKLTSSLSPVAKSEIFRLLLERRCLVPFIIPRNDGLMCEWEALNFTNTSISTNTMLNLMTDIQLPRIAVISENATKRSCTSMWIDSIFNISSIYCMDAIRHFNVTDIPCAAELGWGFLKSEDGFHPVILLHVIGDYKEIYQFIREFADVLVIDDPYDCSTADLTHSLILRWHHAETVKEVESVSQDSKVKTIVLECDAKDANSCISEILLENLITRPRIKVDAINLDGSIKTRTFKSWAEEICLGVDFLTLRPKQFPLQKLFADEARLKTKAQHEINDATLATLLKDIAAIQSEKRAIAIQADVNPLVGHLVQVLRQPAPEVREAGIIDLEQQLSDFSGVASAGPREKYRHASRLYNQAKITHEEYMTALTEWHQTICGLEHLWRELSHLFATDTTQYSHLPMLAAKHLLDGFPMELMDGDAAMVNLVWIKAILNQLGDLLPNARIFVLSIMGVQSSGKSTLLNYMFGVRLRTSVSRCTRGVNIQLLKCDGREEYEYILLLDTEGIRSPEHISDDTNVWRDNRMATLAILPSDATIILTKGESTTAISEILPIVLSVFLDSELAESISGHMATKFYFVFNQIDTSQSENMEVIVNTLVENLRLNAAKIQAIRSNKVSMDGDANEVPMGHFANFQVNIENEQQSDIRFFNTIKGSSQVPMDIPNCDFGKRAFAFREYIHRRATQPSNGSSQLKAKSIADFTMYLNLVWECITKSNFQLNFIAAHERMLFEILMQTITSVKQEMAQVYANAFDEVLKRMCEDEAQRLAVKKTKYEYIMKNLVHSAITDLDKRLRKMLEDNKFEKWRQDQLIKWENHKQCQQDLSVSMIQEKVFQVFHAGAHVAKYQDRLQNTLKIMIQNKQFTFSADFPKVFENVLRQVEIDHPSTTRDIATQINKVFFQLEALNASQIQMLKRGRPEHNESHTDDPQALTRANVEMRINNLIDTILTNVRRYGDEVVLECICKTKEWIAEEDVCNSLRNVALYQLYVRVHERLKKLEETWQSENGVIGKFLKCKPTLEAWTQNLCNGYKATELLIKTMQDWVAHNLIATVDQHLVDYVATCLKYEKWFTNAEAMQALLDKSLLTDVKAKRYGKILNEIIDPGLHTKRVLTNEITKLIKKKADEVQGQVVRTTKEAVHTAANCAFNAKTNRSTCFLTALRQNLQHALKLSGTCDLVLHLPRVDEAIMNCDKSGPQIFKKDSQHGVLLAILTSIDSQCKLKRLQHGQAKALAAKVIARMYDKSFGAGDGIVPRCGKPCPQCACPCIKAYGHQNDNDKRHDTFHQPEGLSGVYWSNSKELCASSCVTSVIKDYYMQVKNKKGERDRASYKEFDKVYPTWTMPSFKIPLPLREYIFAHCQKQLVAKFKRLECPNIPASYFSHDLGDIERQIKQTLGILR